MHIDFKEKHKRKMSCVFCNAEANLREKTGHGNIYCGSKCQFLHYAMIGAGGEKRVLDDEGAKEFTHFEELPFETQVHILKELDDFPTMLRLCRSNTAFRAYCGEMTFRKAYVAKHRVKVEQYFMKTFTDTRVVMDQAHDLESWLLILIEDEEYQLYPDTLYSFVARFNLVKTAEVLIFKPQADWRQFFDAMAFYAIKEDYVEIVEAWLAHTVELIGYEDPALVADHLDYLLQLCLTRQSHRCYRVVVQRNPLDFSLEDMIRTVGNLDSSALNFVRMNIDFRALRPAEFTFLLERYCVRVQTDLFIHLVISSEKRVKHSLYYDLLRRILYFKYSEELVKLITFIYSRMPLLEHGAQWAVWSRDGVSPNSIIFGIWLSHFRMNLTYSIWAECIMNMIQLNMDRNLITMVLDMENAPIGADELRTEFKKNIFQFSMEDIQFLLQHQRIFELFEPVELHFYLDGRV